MLEKAEKINKSSFNKDDVTSLKKITQNMGEIWYAISDITFVTNAMCHTLNINIPDHILVFPYGGFDVTTKRYNDLDGFIFTTLSPQRIFPNPRGSKKILFSGLVDGNHWMLIELDIKHEDNAKLILNFRCHNPFNDSTVMDDTYFSGIMKKWSLDIAALYQKAYETSPDITMNNICESKPIQQFDGSSCGPILCQNIINIIQGKPATQVYPCGALELRKQQLTYAEHFVDISYSFPEVAEELRLDIGQIDAWTEAQKALHMKLSDLCQTYLSHRKASHASGKEALTVKLLEVLKNPQNESFPATMLLFVETMVKNKDSLAAHRDNSLVQFFNSLWHLIKNIFSPSQETMPSFWKKSDGKVLCEQLEEILMTENIASPVKNSV